MLTESAAVMEVEGAVGSLENLVNLVVWERPELQRAGVDVIANQTGLSLDCVTRLWRASDLFQSMMTQALTRRAFDFHQRFEATQLLVGDLLAKKTRPDDRVLLSRELRRQVGVAQEEGSGVGGAVSVVVKLEQEVRAESLSWGGEQKSLENPGHKALEPPGVRPALPRAEAPERIELQFDAEGDDGEGSKGIPETKVVGR